jgi:hypothetical protein
MTKQDKEVIAVFTMILVGGFGLMFAVALLF